MFWGMFWGLDPTKLPQHGWMAFAAYGFLQGAVNVLQYLTSVFLEVACGGGGILESLTRAMGAYP